MRVRAEIGARCGSKPSTVDTGSRPAAQYAGKPGTPSVTAPPIAYREPGRYLALRFAVRAAAIRARQARGVPAVFTTGSRPPRDINVFLICRRRCAY